MTTTLDDRYPGFTYKGVWTLQGNPTAEWDGTTSATYVAGSTVSLSFAGLQITVFGTIAPNGIGVAPSSSYSIDGGPQAIFTGVQQFGAQYMQTFFQSSILSGSANHTLTITSLIDSGEFFLDFVNILNPTTTAAPTSQVTSTTASPSQKSTSSVTTFPGPTTVSTSSTSSVTSTTSSAVAPPTTSSTSTSSTFTATPTGSGSTVIIDDRNTSLVYAGSWNQGGTSFEFAGTVTWTNASGSTASVDFSGTQISVWGTIGTIGVGVAPQSSYSIDDGTPVSFVGIQQSNTQYMQLFFQSDTLPLNNHTLRIETLASGGDYYLDFLSVVPQNVTGVSSPSVSMSPTIAPTAAHSSAKNVPIGAIVGGVLGGIAVIALTVIAVLLLKRKQKDESHKVDYFPVTQVPKSPGMSTVYPAAKGDIMDGHDATASNSYFSHHGHRPAVPPPKYEKH